MIREIGRHSVYLCIHSAKYIKVRPLEDSIASSLLKAKPSFSNRRSVIFSVLSSERVGAIDTHDFAIASNFNRTKSTFYIVLDTTK